MGQLVNIDQAQVQSTKANISIVASLKVSNAQIQQTLQQHLDIDAVENSIEDIGDPIVDLNETNAAVGQNFSTPNDLDKELDTDGR